MAIIKLVCQSCGANLDALDTSRIITCGYCGTQNQIKPTVYHEAPPAPAPPPFQPTQPMHPHMQPMQHVQPPVMQYQVGAPIHRRPSNGGRVGVIVFAAVIPLFAGGVIAFLALKSADSVMRGQSGGRALAGEGPARQYRWESGRPFVADVDGDGSEDLLGIIQVMGTPNLSIVAISGADWSVLWETDIGDRSTMPEQPQLRFVGDHAAVVFAMGAAVRAYDAKTGQSKWVANLPDKTAMIVLDGDQLWARSIDESMHTIALATGSVTPATGDPSAAAKPLRTDEGYDLIPSNRQLELEYEQFADVRIETAFCPPELLAVTLAPVRGFGTVPCTWKHGLAWAARSKGTSVPFLIGYDPATKQERWRNQLTAPGSLETIDSGFNQPRAEFVDDDAIVSFSPSNANGAVTLRRLDMLAGATKWETTLDRKMTENLDGMVVGKDRLYADHGGCMVVIELATGNVIERLGGW
jgi:outer membrane protein assembly factor BamB/DNA-directed RNA polymerase subunit RPC12/RpoP